MTETDDRYAFALKLIAEAGELAMYHFSRLEELTVETKKNHQDVVSEADRGVEDLIRQRLATDFPDDGILGEERGSEPGTSGWTWVVDPIDGTSCFLSGLRDWCLSIAAVHQDEIRLGIILQPTTGDLYAACRDRGAVLNGKAIRVNDAARIDAHLLGFGANFRIPRRGITAFADRLLEAGGMFYRNGSGALMLAYVAAGRLAGYYEAHINAWDCLAGLLLIREAGGWAADFPGAHRTLQAGGPILAAAPRLREELIALVARAEADQ